MTIDDLPLVALLPTHPEFDEEAKCAALSLPVVRFGFLEAVRLEEPVPGPCRALHRGFMLSAERYQLLSEGLEALQVYLVVGPEEYERAHYYPLAYPFISTFSPRAVWVEVLEPSMLGPTDFSEAVTEVEGWGCRHVVLKDFVKSLKEEGGRFMHADVDPELPDLACELVRIRGRRFNRGVVFKELVELTHYSTRGGYVTNEWRLWLGRGGRLLTVAPNSFQDRTCERVPEATLDLACQAARALGNPYMSIDVAETDEGWVAIEAGDGGVSGPAPCQDMAEHWRALADCFGAN